MLKKTLRAAFNSIGLEVHSSTPSQRAESFFRSHDYLRHNARRLEHLASLGIPVTGKTVLEVGAGIGDHSHYYMDRNCKITITEVRTENLNYLRARYPNHDIQLFDLEQPNEFAGSFDVVHCYGLLYHISNPRQALACLSRLCSGVLLLETCVSFGDRSEINPVKEDAARFTQANSGTGCRPTRIWLFEYLKSLFEFVYIPSTQPNHEEFPLDWTNPAAHAAGLSRCVFIASRDSIENPLLSPSLLDRQIRHA